MTWVTAGKTKNWQNTGAALDTRTLRGKLGWEHGKELIYVVFLFKTRVLSTLALVYYVFFGYLPGFSFQKEAWYSNSDFLCR